MKKNKNPNIQRQIAEIPNKPGIYQFFTNSNELLYIGKAIDLKKRVNSYFKSSSNLLPKTQLMVSQIEHIETIVVESEIEALLLEAELIKKENPKYNHQLKDDKSYIYIHFSKDNFPRIHAARKNQIKPNEKTVSFGPFTSSRIVKQTLKELRKVFPYRSCTNNRFKQQNVCLYYHIGLCQGPCENKVTEDQYHKDIKNFQSFLKRKTKTIVRNLNNNMKKASAEQKFELAATIRDQIDRLQFLITDFRLPEEYIRDPNLIEDIRTQTLLDMQKRLSLPLKPNRIECYDISNIQGKSATGSMVVFNAGEPDKKEYRRFKIKSKETPDDYGMLQEVLRRRFVRTITKTTKESWPKPDLIVIDGGAGQLSATTEIINKYKLNIPVISLAKKNEEIYYQNNKITLSKRSPVLQLLQHMRDEAHRFAITYHRKLREEKNKLF